MKVYKTRSEMLSYDSIDQFINRTPDIILTSDYDGNIITCNKTEVIKKHNLISDFFNKEANITVYDNLIKTLKDGRIYSEDVEMIVDEKHMMLYICAMNIPRTKRYVFFVKDENKQLRKQQELCDKIDKYGETIKEKEMFIANLSHEIKTPMNIIVGMIYFLKSTALDEKQLKYVTKLDEASKLLLEISSGILNLSEDTQYSLPNFLSDFNMNQFLNNIVDAFKEKAESKGLQLFTDIKFKEDIDVHADKAKINQVFVNLLENAVKYTDKGYIELSASKVEETNVNYKLQFCLKDTGIGIKKEDTLKIFREFSQTEDPTKKTQDGKGIGLAIVKKIVEDMQGKIWVESSVGLGSKFYFTIVMDKCGKAIGNSDNVERKYLKQDVRDLEFDDSGEKRILLVEDNKLNIEITKDIIESDGYICDVAEDGVSCIKRIQEVGAKYYNLILMDIHMPRYNGYEIAKILRNDFRIVTPIVALTATNVTDKIVKENANYIDDYILKPVVPEELRSKLKTIFERNQMIGKKNSKKDNILLIDDNEENTNQLKAILNDNYEVIVASTELDIDILLQAGTMKAILVDELENLDSEIRIVNNIRVNSNVQNIPIVLISRNKESKLKERSFETYIDGMIESDEVEQCNIALYNILRKVGEKDELKNQVQKSKEETEKVYNFLFDSMVNLTSARSKETGAHLKRTKEYMKVMLTKYEDFYKEGLFTTKEVIEDIAMAAVLHDIGKVGIPDNILNKPGKLTDEEYEIMKSHTTIGRDILETAYGNQVSNNILNYAKDIVYHHHEKYDGSGYPEHLKGEEITVVSRLMALVDVYDALANKRVYKPPVPYDELEEYIVGQAGKAFDPKAVNVFSMVKDKLREINEMHKDEE